jgi:hypothetical protein
MSNNNLESGDQSERGRPVRPIDQAGSFVDREVPLVSTGTSDMINRWLDGESAEPTGLRGDAAKSVEFWRRLGEETDRRRQVVTPAHVPAQILAQLPSVAPRSSTASWLNRDVKLSPMALIAGAAGVFVLGALLARVLI